MKTTTIGIGCAAALLLASAPASAQVGQEGVIEEDLKKEVISSAAQVEEEQQGWKLGLSLGSTISFNHNSNVVGTPDGVQFQIGVLLDTYANLRAEQHEWLNSLAFRETFTKTPTIDLFLKSQDTLLLKTTYLYHIPEVDWLGPFVRLSFDATVFPGYDARDADVVLRKTRNDGTVTEDPVAAQEAITLTGWMEPSKLKEVAGLFANPVDDEQVKLSVQLGVGSLQVFTQEGFVVTDDDETPELELTQLEDFIQVGGELEVVVSGVVNQIILWNAGASFFQPFYTTEDRGLEGVDLMVIDLHSGISVKLAEWASLDYVLGAKRDPLILDEWQVHNGILFTAGFNVFDPEPAPAKAPVAP